MYPPPALPDCTSYRQLVSIAQRIAILKVWRIYGWTDGRTNRSQRIFICSFTCIWKAPSTIPMFLRMSHFPSSVKTVPSYLILYAGLMLVSPICNSHLGVTTQDRSEFQTFQDNCKYKFSEKYWNQSKVIGRRQKLFHIMNRKKNVTLTQRRLFSDHRFSWHVRTNLFLFFIFAKYLIIE